MHSVHPPFLLGGGGVEPPTKFSIRGGEGLTGSQFVEGVAGKREGVTFFRDGGCSFYLKSEIFNDKYL